MPKDIRKLLENYPEESVNLSENHSDKFKNKLMKELHKEQPKRQPWKWLSIAASIALLVTVSIQFWPDSKPPITKKAEKKITLGSISPELKTIEAYYTNSINLGLSELEMTEENKEILNSYLNKLKELTDEYKTLTEELSKKGVNDQTVGALISNLQLRLQLLQRLKKQLKDLKELKTQENDTQII